MSLSRLATGRRAPRARCPSRRSLGREPGAKGLDAGLRRPGLGPAAAASWGDLRLCEGEIVGTGGTHPRADEPRLAVVAPGVTVTSTPRQGPQRRRQTMLTSR